jgi:hypothetical protein
MHAIRIAPLALSGIRGNPISRRTLRPISAASADACRPLNDVGRRLAVCTGKTRDVLDHAKVRASTYGAPPAKAFHEIHRRTLDCAHAPGVSMSSHVRLDPGGTALLDCRTHCALEFGSIDNPFLEHLLGRRLPALTAHHDDAMAWVSHCLGEDHGLARTVHDGVSEIRIGALIVPDDPQGFLAISEHDDFMRERQKRDLRVRPEIPLTRQRESSLWNERERRLDLGPGRIQL